MTAGSGDEVSIEAVKKTRGDKSELANVQIIVDDRAGRVDVRPEYEQNRSDRSRRGNSVSVDYTVTCLRQLRQNSIPCPGRSK